MLEVFVSEIRTITIASEDFEKIRAENDKLNKKIDECAVEELKVYRKYTKLLKAVRELRKLLDQYSRSGDDRSCCLSTWSKWGTHSSDCEVGKIIEKTKWLIEEER